VTRVQWAGATGFVFVNYYDELFTFIPYLSAVNITISGIGGVTIGENPIDAEDIESKDV
jgi:hypothetical protein